MRVSAEHLYHTYGKGLAFETAAIKDVSFTIEEGEFVSFIGSTGCGKSTLAQHLNGLLKPDSGKVLVDGKDINEKTDEAMALRHRIGLVFQYPEYQLFEETVIKDVMFGPKNLGCSEEDALRRSRGALSLVSIDPDIFGQRSPFELSGGQKRRVAIAGVLAMEPELLILDEPTAGLDPQGHDEILDMIMALRKDPKLSIVMISHNMADVTEFSDKVLLLSHGELLKMGTPAEVFGDEDLMARSGILPPPSASFVRRLAEKDGRFSGLGLALTAEAAADEIAKSLLV